MHMPNIRFHKTDAKFTCESVCTDGDPMATSHKNVILK